MTTALEMDLVGVPVDVVRQVVRALGRASRFGEAFALLDAVGDDPRLALVTGEVAVSAHYVAGATAAPDVDAALAAARRAADDGTAGEPAEGVRWDVGFLGARHAYMTQLFLPGTQLASPEGRDPGAVAELESALHELRDAAPDVRRRGWAEFYLGIVQDNLHGRPEASPVHLEAAHAAAVESGDDYLLFEALRHLGDHARDAGAADESRAMWEESAAAAARAGGVSQVLAQVVLLALLAQDRGESGAAALLAGEVERWAEAIGAERLAAQARDIASA